MDLLPFGVILIAVDNIEASIAFISMHDDDPAEDCRTTDGSRPESIPCKARRIGRFSAPKLPVASRPDRRLLLHAHITPDRNEATPAIRFIQLL